MAACRHNLGLGEADVLERRRAPFRGFDAACLIGRVGRDAVDAQKLEQAARPAGFDWPSVSRTVSSVLIVLDFPSWWPTVRDSEPCVKGCRLGIARVPSFPAMRTSPMRRSVHDENDRRHEDRIGGLMAQPNADGKREMGLCFVPGNAEGSASMSELLGGKGANLAEMAALALPGAAGLHDHDRGLQSLLCGRTKAARGPEGRGDASAATPSATRFRRKFGDEKRPLLVSVRSGSRASMPGHDGHDFEPRSQRQDGRGSGRADGRSRALPSTAIAASSRCTATSCWASITAPSRIILENFKNLNGFAADTDLDAEAWHEIIADYKAAIEREHRRAVPAGYEPSSFGARSQRCSIPGTTARQDLSPAARHPRRLGHRRHRSGHGLRQPRRQLRDRRRLHPQSFDRREGNLRRIPAQCAGRGRRRRHPHAARR